MRWLGVIFVCSAFWGTRANGQAAETVYYRSGLLRFQSLKEYPGAFLMNDDKGLTTPVTLFLNARKQLFWYRRLFTEVCLSGECRPIDIGIYWTVSGQYAGVDVYRENLTKTDHSDFSDADYRKLEAILADEWSPLREFAFDELIEEKGEDVDATTGATKKVIADAAVADAVYTTYTMWHLIHVGENEQLALLSYRFLSEHPEMLDELIPEAARSPEYADFILEGLAGGHLPYSQACGKLILHQLNEVHREARSLAFKTLHFLPWQDSSLQSEIAAMYPSWPVADKIRLLRLLVKTEQLQASLYDALAADLKENNEWFLTALLQVLKKSGRHSDEVLSRIRELADSRNEELKKEAQTFRDH